MSLVMEIDIWVVMRRTWATTGERCILGCFGDIKIQEEELPWNKTQQITIDRGWSEAGKVAHSVKQWLHNHEIMSPNL